MASNNTASQTRTNLWMSGTSNVTFNGTSGTVTVPLSFVAAKIELIVKDNRSNLTGSGSITIADEKVVLLYAGKSGKFFGQQPKRLLKPLSIRVMPLIRVLIQTLSQHLLPWQMR